MFNIIPSIKSVKPENTFMKKLSISPAFTLDSLLIFVLFQPYTLPPISPLLGFKTITFTKDSLLSPYNCLRKLTGIKVYIIKQRRTLFLQHSNHGKALTVYPYVFPIGLLLQKRACNFAT
jgi:hypothetical protein